MEPIEYLLLPVADDPSENVRVSVTFSGEGAIASRDVCLRDFLILIAEQGQVIRFDDYPCVLTSVRVDFAKRQLRLAARPWQESDGPQGLFDSEQG
ncbi:MULTISPECIES: hypothetical protein [Rhodobacterales]|uniref:hypothetical protein n=1 Tax=Rhodobacterales TaxID=204455 RepID=UPI001109FA2E|nr:MULTISPECIES: hypothetical protein [Rhodobacterales]